MILSFHYCSPSPPFSSLPLAVKLPPNGFCLIEMAHLGTVDPNLIALWGPQGSRSNSDPLVNPLVQAIIALVAIFQVFTRNNIHFSMRQVTNVVITTLIASLSIVKPATRWPIISSVETIVEPVALGRNASG